MKMPAKQRGVALVTAILLVAIATAIAAKLTWDNQVAMRRAEMSLAQEQGRAFALGAEAIAIDQLIADTERSFDHEAEDWATPVPPFVIGIGETELGTIEGRLQDAQGRFNLNNLVQAGSGLIDEPSREQFQRLLDYLRLDPGIADAVADWIDADTVPQGAGAEDGTYTALDPGYRPANNYLQDISELRLVTGIEEESYNALLPHVTALPPGWCGSAGQPIAVNINGASAEVIAALDENISLGQAQAWVEERTGTGWTDWTEIGGLPESFTALQGQYASLSSGCFELRALVNIGRSVLSMYSLLDRSSVSGQVVTRTRVFGVE